MATQITFTDDVISHATAGNDDGSIRWHAYTRVIAGKPAVYVQRQTGGVLGEGGSLEAEVLLMQEGTVFSLTFNSLRAQWDLVYEINEILFLVTIDETDVPSTQVPQTEVFVSDYSFRPGAEDPAENSSRNTLELAKKYLIQNQRTQIYTGGDPVGVTLTASPNPGKLKVKWSEAPNVPREQILGFNVYVLDGAFGRFIKLTTTPVPFVEQPGIRQFEFEVPARKGTYFVTQIDQRGLETGHRQLGVAFGLTSNRAVEGRRQAGDFIGGNGREMAFAASDFDLRPGGEGHAPTTVTKVDKAPIFLGIIADSFSKVFPGGEGHAPTTVTKVDKAPVLLKPPGGDDVFDLRPGGEGIRSAFTLTGFGTIIVT